MDYLVAAVKGAQCAELVAKGYREGHPSQVDEVGFASRIMQIPDRPWEESTFCHDGCRGTDQAALERARRRYDPEERAVRQRGATSCLVEIAALALADVAIVTNPGELFVEFGLQIQEVSPFETTMVAELTNGYCGYIPTRQAFAHGGYETHRTVYTSRLVENAGSQLVEASSKLLDQIR